jgi:hypothetical protein
MNNSCGRARPLGGPTKLADGATLRPCSSQL